MVCKTVVLNEWPFDPRLVMYIYLLKNRYFVSGYVIPKDTLVFSVLYHILRDPDYWPNPNSFMPERFLSPDGKQVIKEERFIPFGVGNYLATIAEFKSLVVRKRLIYLIKAFDRKD